MDARPQKTVRASRRVLLFHVAAILDPNECELECLKCPNEDRTQYFSCLYHAVGR